MYHDCSGCQGTKFQGANLTCNRCLRPFFLECLAAKKEFLYLIGALNAYTQPHSSPTTLQNKVQKLFGNDTLLHFTCIKCNEMGTFFDAVNQAKSNEILIQQKIGEIDAYKSQLGAANENLRQIESTNAQCNTTITQLHTELGELRTKYLQMEQINAELNQTIINMKENQMDGIQEEDTTDLSKIMNRFDVLTKDIEARVKLECDKVMSAIVGDANQAAKKRKMNGQEITFNTPTTSQHQNTIDLTWDGKGQVTKLKPPKKRENDKRDVYHIHVSQFDVQHTEQQIENYVRENTGINVNGLFKVTKLVSKKRNFNEDDEYCSFKITTIHHDVYKKISNSDLWEPEFQVRDFTSSPPKENRPNPKRSLQIQQQHNQMSGKNVQYNDYTKRNEQAEQRKNMNPNAIHNKHLSNIKMTPKMHASKVYSPRKSSAPNQTYSSGKQSTAPAMIPVVQQPYYFFPANQIGQNFQMGASYPTPMIPATQAQHQQQPVSHQQQLQHHLQQQQQHQQ